MDSPIARRIATALHRGILKREPDPTEVNALAAVLLEDRSTERLLDLIRSINRSEEARGVASKLHGGGMRRRPSPVGPINHVISLGTLCYPGWIIKQLGLKRHSYPFDWIFSNPGMVLDMLRDDFQRFLNPVFHHANPPETRPRPTEHIAEHLYYREHYGVEHVFSHRDVTAAAGRAYYQRAVERFRKVLASEESKLLFMVCPPGGDIMKDDFEALCELIDRKARNAMLLAVNVSRVENGDAAQSGARLSRLMRHHQLVDYRASSEMTGLAFGNWLDDISLRAMISQYRMEIPER
jgi:hypothetical protein